MDRQERWTHASIVLSDMDVEGIERVSREIAGLPMSGVTLAATGVTVELGGWQLWVNPSRWLVRHAAVCAAHDRTSRSEELASLLEGRCIEAAVVRRDVSAGVLTTFHVTDAGYLAAWPDEHAPPDAAVWRLFAADGRVFRLDALGRFATTRSE